jgi:Uma2 family endonuclease
MVSIAGGRPLTEEERKLLFFVTLDDDTEDAPWMVMGSLQFAASSDLFQSLRDYAARNRLPWFVAGMHPIRFTWPPERRKHQLAPDVFVAFAPDHPRSSFDLAVERHVPPFVLEVVSPSSVERDEGDKRWAYEFLGVREYALFTPSADQPSRLTGYRLNATGTFDPWPTDAAGRLWSEVLGLYLVVQGTTIRAATPDGALLPTLTEAVEAREQAVVENERLRRELERLRRESRPE